MTTLTTTIRKKIQNINHRVVAPYKLTSEPIWCPELAAQIPMVVGHGGSQQGSQVSTR